MDAEPLQSDQSAGRAWGPPHDELTTFPRIARVGDYLDGTRKADGFYTGQIGWMYWTEGQLAYIDYKFGWSDAVWTADATLEVRVGTGLFICLQCKLHRPVPGDDYKHGERGVTDVIVRYTNGVSV